MDVISATIEQHGGRVVNYAGDAVLAEFGAVLDAISSAIEIQGELKIRNEGQPEDESVQFRIGLNLGDVIEDRGDIYGDGVNVAARLEGLAEPGGICISESIRTAVANRLPIGYEFLGEREVKNIAEPVRAYKVVAEPVQLGNSEPVPPPLSDLTLPSVAVLPFTNMSGDPEQEYFGDGVAEDIITALSKVRNMMVIARNSSFIYKGAPVDVKQVGREQGVRYVLEGSVRRSGNRLRITAQLIDAESAHYLWSERYDRLAEDVFDVQDEITREVTAALQVELTQGEQARLWASGTKHLEAWELAVQGRFLVDSHHRDSVRKSQQLTQRAVQLDENYANAWSILAQTYWSEALNKRMERISRGVTVDG
ncbi:MAG: hypothetical protein OEU36_20650 [Gammaproteobacteria bacterium]|nr:hypothetical protein [Gammaproteobacteria bacterium]